MATVRIVAVGAADRAEAPAILAAEGPHGEGHEEGLADRFGHVHLVNIVYCKGVVLFLLFMLDSTAGFHVYGGLELFFEAGVHRNRDVVETAAALQINVGTYVTLNKQAIAKAGDFAFTHEVTCVHVSSVVIVEGKRRGFNRQVAHSANVLFEQLCHVEY